MEFEDRISVRTIDSHRLHTNQDNLVGFCRYRLHPGCVTKKILKAHKCLEKGCPFLTRYEANPYWREIERQERRKAKTKERRQLHKEAEAVAKASIAKRTAEFQEIADSCGYNMQIVRVERPNPRMFHVLYVSNYTYADGHKFPNFIYAIHNKYGVCGVRMRHVRDVDGRFVTIEEFNRRRKS